ncbi:MAG: hypothetical protein HYU39_10355 [Thaumarchaeota archaeon]|nr:hypothetical protein [Nitrososphaerota archaeon]
MNTLFGFKMNLQKSGLIGIVLTAVGVVLLLFTFSSAFDLFSVYSSLTLTGGDFIASLNKILVAAIQAMFLGVMGWVGSILLLRGVDFMKVDRGVGVVTFRVEKGVGIATLAEGSETASSENKEGKK